MATFVVDTSQVEARLADFPVGPIEATVKTVKPDVSKKGGSMLVLELEIYHPSVGAATIKDWLPASFPGKVKAFWMAINDFTSEQMAANPMVEINPPDLVGAQFILNIGREEEKVDGKPTGRIFTKVTPPWYYPISRTDLLPVPEDVPL